MMTTADPPVTLTEFLLARIAEDEDALRVARLDGDDDRQEWWMPEQWTRARGYAECEAKRRIVALHSRYECDTAGYPGHERCGEIAVCDKCDDARFPCDTLRLLALPHADHPDWREEWRP